MAEPRPYLTLEADCERLGTYVVPAGTPVLDTVLALLERVDG